ncbi:hypothetical protein SAMN05216317_11241 [Nitrosomonas eutropha]|uniref:Uncharacterized protein n=1 Tax=Nitrosomonas eutropha TaxID=916 RepID=A0ABX5M6N0_9PROT|nr:hypothetical protein C8R14_11914 [Nitrosomonas eutropha]SCX21302.1 hypothetical protein SAMN05216379_11627 [Nitrosomonas eutropha]SDW77509.1 hypothetical protein SAMN05216317_11241 [Nitrosomonas eutropha]
MMIAAARIAIYETGEAVFLIRVNSSRMKEIRRLFLLYMQAVSIEKDMDYVRFLTGI